MAPKAKAGSKPSSKAGSKTSPELEEPPPVTEEQLHGDFAFEDGSTYVGQYLKSSVGDLTYHGEGLLKNGPETFQGVFERGLYKAGRLERSGAVYEGPFRGGKFHGLGAYSWAGGQSYRGTWKDGAMHGRGRLEGFQPGEAYEGFCIDGEFSSDQIEQQKARNKFIAEYSGDVARSAGAALKSMAEGATAEGVPPDYVVGGPGATRSEVEAVVHGPYPEASLVPQDALQSFAALLDEQGNPGGTPAPDSPSALHVNVVMEPKQARHIASNRLRLPQLAIAGQAVEFASPPGEADNKIRAVVLVNVSREFDLAKASWKLVHLEVEAATE